ncbi:MAG TPA: MOSC domain-containing protein [Jiangellaceae bacterium]
MRIVSVNIGKPRPNVWKAGAEFTGIDKHPVEGSVEVRAARAKPSGEVGLAGDRVGDVRNHGGANQAVYAYARADYDHFEKILGRELRSGMFGDNLTVEGYDLCQARSGERWRGPDGLVLEVTSPRIPCGTFRGWMDEKGWLRTFTKQARSGAYLKVVAPGAVAKGIELEIVYRPDNDLTMTNLFRAGMGDRELATRFLDSGALNEDMADYFRALYKLD